MSLLVDSESDAPLRMQTHELKAERLGKTIEGMVDARFRPEVTRGSVESQKLCVRRKQSPMPFGNNVDFTAFHGDGRLIIDGIYRC